MENKLKAIDLMLLDVKTSHPEIRIQAKNLNCEEELNSIQDEIVEYLLNNRTLITKDLQEELINVPIQNKED